MKILAICGSLRAASSNRVALEAARLLAPPGVQVSLYEGLADLPAFNPDVDDAPPPRAAALRAEVSASDAVLISSPEYAHGVAGAMKNALDWLVGSLDFDGKPVAMINTSPRASLAQAQMLETLRTMSAQVVEAACIELPLMGRGLDAAGVVADAALAAGLGAAVQALAQAAEAGQAVSR